LASSAPTTNVPFPAYGPNGIQIPLEGAVLAGVIADWQAAAATVGLSLSFTTAAGAPVNATPQSQLAQSWTAILGDNFAMFAWFVSQVDPQYSSGRMQDGIGRIYFISRIPGLPTVQPCTCSGLQGVPIANGTLAQDPETQLLWVCTQQGEIGSSGSVVLNFSCANLGPTAAPESLRPFQQVNGWDSVAPAGDAVLGRLVESRSQFEERRSLSTGINSMGPINAVYGGVAAVPGVLDLYCYSNDSDTPLTIGGLTLNANATYVCFLGGDSGAVALAAWQRKGIGSPWYTSGNTTITVPDPNPAYVSPVPEYTVVLEAAGVVPFAAVVTMTNNAGIPSDALTQVQGAITAAFAGLDGGSRARIGSTVLASRYYGGVLALGSWAQVVEIQIGLSGAASQFTGAISGTTLTTSAATGTIAVGQLVQDSAGLVANGTIITAGSGTSWTVSISQTVTSEAMTGTTLVNSVTVDINQAPGISAANIAVVLV
jgi:hypothetical protein